jgi:hypothetical protein
VTDVWLNTEDITVLGPPEVVELLVDIGPKGDRGSQIYVGSGDPNSLMSGTTLFGNQILLNDLYINTSPGANYGYMYQYISQPGGNSWVEILEINPTIYSKSFLTTYEDGAAEIVIPISNIVTVSGTPLTADNFSVQYSIAHTNPVATSMQIPGLVGSGTQLVINFSGIEYTGSAWQDLNDSVTTHIFITIVNVEA